MIQYLGWSATAVFVGSYFCSRSDTLRRVQMAGALMWVVYGLLITAYPVVVANLLVFGAAAWTSKKSSVPGSEVLRSKVPGFLESEPGTLNVEP